MADEFIRHYVEGHDSVTVGRGPWRITKTGNTYRFEFWSMVEGQPHPVGHLAFDGVLVDPTNPFGGT